MNGLLHVLTVFFGLLCLLGGVGGVGGTLIGTFFGVSAGALGGILVNVLLTIALPGIPGMYGSGSVGRWFCLSLPAGALGGTAGTLISTTIGGIVGALPGMLIGGLVAAGGTFFLQKVIPDWKRDRRTWPAARSR